MGEIIEIRIEGITSVELTGPRTTDTQSQPCAFGFWLNWFIKMCVHLRLAASRKDPRELNDDWVLGEWQNL